MEKSPEAFRTISEVAELLDTPAHVLRFWESRFPQIRPVKRAGGRRYYRPGDVALLSGIKRLLHEDGLTIRGVQKILREHGVRHVAGLSAPDAAGIVPDDIEAALTQELGAERVAAEAPPAPAAAQTAQIISLERALARGEAETGPATGQGLLWPNPAEDARLPEAEDVPPADVEEAPFVEVEEAELGATVEALVPPARPMQDEVSATSAGASDVPDEEARESEESAAALEEAPTIASVLRRRPAGSLRHAKPELEALVVRIQDLRDRLAEASRRRAR